MDGWSEEVQDCLEEVFSELEDTIYEVRSCVRGSFTNAKTNEELADWMQILAEKLTSAAECLTDCEDNSTMEDEE